LLFKLINYDLFERESIMKKLLLLMLVSMVVTGVASAAVKWVAPPPGPANWNVASNWDTVTIPISSDKVQFGADAAECIVDDSDPVTPGIQPTLCGQLVLGDNGGDDLEHYLTIPSGSSLHTCVPGDSWTAAGYNRVGVMTVERGGSLIAGSRLGVGLIGSKNPTVPSYLNVKGGYVSIDGNLQIGETNHIGIVNVESGTLEATGWEWRDDTGTWSFMDIGLGTVIIDGDVTGNIPDLISSGALIGFGGSSTVTYDYNVTNPGSTTLKADDPLDRTPAMDALIGTGTVNLSWKNVGTAPVWVDVWYGTDTDPCSGFTKVVSKSQDLTTWPVSAPVFDEYVWRVDTYDHDPASDPNAPEEGEAMYFVATDDFPPSVVIDSNDIGTWAGESVVVAATVTDDDLTQVVVDWSSPDEPNIIFTNETFDTVTGIATVTVTGDSWQNWSEITITVGDQLWPDADSDTSLVDVARDACHAAGGGSPHLWNVYTADFDQNCIVDLADFAVVYQQWLDKYELTVPLEVP